MTVGVFVNLGLFLNLGASFTLWAFSRILRVAIVLQIFLQFNVKDKERVSLFPTDGDGSSFVANV